MNEIDDSLLRQLYGLPAELFIRVLDFLDFDGILGLCYDSDFPFNLVHRRHIEPNGDQRSILHAAAKTGYSRITAIKEFIKILGTCDHEDSSCMTPLALAAQKPNYQLCRALLQAGARVDGCGTCREESPLWNASRISGNGDTVSLLLEHGAKLFFHYDFDEDDDFYGAPLNVVADPEIAKLLIARGANVNNRSYQGTPRTVAVDAGRLDLVQPFLDAGADVDINNGVKGSALVSAIIDGGVDMVRLLIDAGCDVNRENWDRRRPLELALVHEKEDVARMLLEAGADVSGHAVYGDSILSAAVRYCSPSLVQDLIDCGAEVGARNKCTKRTCLFYAIKQCKADMVQLLLDANCNPSYIDDFGIQPALLATAGSDDYLLLIATYKNRSIKKISRFIPLDHVTDKAEGHIAILKMLIKHGASIDRASYLGIGILHFAVWRNNEEILLILLDGGADPLYKNP